jgi:hypothetical protein
METTMNGGNGDSTHGETQEPAPVETDENGNPVEPKTDETIGDDAA